jgi:hypothetical protein
MEKKIFSFINNFIAKAFKKAVGNPFGELGAPMQDASQDKYEALIAAVQEGDKDKVQSLLDEGVSANSLARGNAEYPLIIAVKQNNAEICRMLLKAGVSVNPVRNIRLSPVAPLVIAALNNNLDICKMLIDKDAHLTLSPFDKQAVTSIAYGNNNQEMVNFLKDYLSDLYPFRKLKHILGGTFYHNGQEDFNKFIGSFSKAPIQWVNENSKELNEQKHPYIKDIKNFLAIANDFLTKVLFYDYTDKNKTKEFKEIVHSSKINESFILPCAVEEHQFYFNIKKISEHRYEVTMSERGLYAYVDPSMRVQLRSIVVDGEKINNIIDQASTLSYLPKNEQEKILFGQEILQKNTGELDKVIVGGNDQGTLFGEKYTLKPDHSLKPFKDGICGYANLKTAVRVMLGDKYGPELGEKYYKDFTISLREVELRNAKNLDFELLKRAGIDLNADSLTDSIEPHTLHKRQKFNLKYDEQDVSKATVVTSGLITEEQGKLFSAGMLKNIGNLAMLYRADVLENVRKIFKFAKESYQNDENKGLTELASMPWNEFREIVSSKKNLEDFVKKGTITSTNLKEDKMEICDESTDIVNDIKVNLKRKLSISEEDSKPNSLNNKHNKNEGSGLRK